MSIFEQAGEVQVEAPRAQDLSLIVRHFADALETRFDHINVGPASIFASTSGLISSVCRGPRTHPLMAYDDARVELTHQGTTLNVRYRFGRETQVFLAPILTLFLPTIAYLESGRSMRFTVFVACAIISTTIMNFVISVVRGREWVVQTAKTGSGAAASSEAATT